MNSKTIILPNGDSLTVEQRRNKWLKLKWFWRVTSEGNNKIIGHSQTSGFHNRKDCVENFARLGKSALGFTTFDI